MLLSLRSWWCYRVDGLRTNAVLAFWGTEVSYLLKNILSPLQWKPRWWNNWRKLLFVWTPCEIPKKAYLPLLWVDRVFSHGVSWKFACGALSLFPACLKKGSKNSAQLYVSTLTVPSWAPTSWAWLTSADSSTTLTMSSRQPTFVRGNALFSRLKHQSGANLVCPTIKRDTVMLSLSPAITLHARYCITYRFLFCVEGEVRLS